MTAYATFKQLFRGNRNAYGVHIPEQSSDVSEGRKLKGRSFTKTEPLPENAYEKHLKGQLSLGIVPINDSSEVYFSAIDVDVYPLNPLVYLKVIYMYNLPLVGFKSKSGGLHLFCFYRQAIKAVNAHKAMNYYRQILGLPESTELFPKQTTLTSTDTGNWINLPYYGGDKTSRYAYDYDGNPLSLENAMKLCVSKTTSYKAIEEGLARLPMNSAPPCLQTIYIIGAANAQSHFRNQYLFNVGVYLKARFGDSFAKKLEQVNAGLPDPLPTAELNNTVINTHNKGDYSYQCKEPCLHLYCDKEICSEREYGKGSDSVTDLSFESLTQVVTDPPYYKWVVNGVEMVFFSEADLRKQDKFTYFCMRYLHKCPNRLKDSVWVGILNKAFSNMQIVDAKEEGSEFSENNYMKNIIEKFLTHRGVVSDLSKLRIGAVCSDEMFYYFRSSDLVSYMEQETRTRIAEPNKLYALLKTLGAEMIVLHIDSINSTMRVWKVLKSVFKEPEHRDSAAFSTEDKNLAALVKAKEKEAIKVQTTSRNKKNKAVKPTSSAEQVIQRLTYEF